MDCFEKEEFLQFCSSTLDDVFDILKDRYQKYGNIINILDGIHNIDNHINGEIISKANRALSSVKMYRADMDYKGKNKIDSFVDIIGWTIGWMWIIKNEEPDFFSDIPKFSVEKEEKNNEENICGN